MRSTEAAAAVELFAKLSQDPRFAAIVPPVGEPTLDALNARLWHQQRDLMLRHAALRDAVMETAAKQRDAGNEAATLATLEALVDAECRVSGVMKRLAEVQLSVSKCYLDHELDRQGDINVTTDSWRDGMRAESNRLEELLAGLSPEQYAVLTSLTPEQVTAVLTSVELPV